MFHYLIVVRHCSVNGCVMFDITAYTVWIKALSFMVQCPQFGTPVYGLSFGVEQNGLEYFSSNV